MKMLKCNAMLNLDSMLWEFVLAQRCVVQSFVNQQSKVVLA